MAVHGGMVKTDSFDTIRSYTLRKMKKHKNCFAFYRVDPPYKPVTTHGVGKKLGNYICSFTSFWKILKKISLIMHGK